MKNPVLRSLESPFLATLKNRIAMSAMTRGFADTGHRATDAMKRYYEARAKNGAGLILTEGVVVHPTGDGYNSVPHMATRAQSESWAPVVSAVRNQGAAFFCQLWHCGRISHPDYTGGVPPVSSTGKAASGINRQNNKPYGEPVALDRDGIRKVRGYYRGAAGLAMDAGFDGIELHLGHGYLADQFFDARINDRGDEYGGSIINRCRFALELVEGVMENLGARHVIVRISPSRDMGGIYDWPDLDEMLEYFIPALWERGVRVLDVSCARADYYQTSGRVIRMIRPLWPGLIMGGASLSVSQADDEIGKGLLDIVTWGRLFISNPDLPRKIERGESFVPFSSEMLSELR